MTLHRFYSVPLPTLTSLLLLGVFSQGEVLAYEVSTGKIELGLGDEKDQM